MSKGKNTAKYTEVAEFLTTILNARRAKNAKYSLRAFARDLKTSPGRVSSILSGHDLPGKILRKRIIATLSLSADKAERLEFLVGKYLHERKDERAPHQLSEDKYTFLPDWHHFAILNLMETVSFKSNPAWIAERLGLTEAVVIESLDCLKQVGLVEERNGQMCPTHKHLTSTHDIPSSALRNFQRQFLNKSMQSLDSDSVELRDITSIIVPTNPHQLYKAKLLARKFRREVSELLEEGDKTEVYNVCVQIVPATRITATL
ncbi:DUF4423 domain-containing protein [Bdellovibrio sp. HCB290]|uniref:DUF4423 domain-containing protein n=1 Tax=Bdellovibrio sp. HCB290 TaxID=3394356 RepID=UPI0039B5717B